LHICLATAIAVTVAPAAAAAARTTGAAVMIHVVAGRKVDAWYLAKRRRIGGRISNHLICIVVFGCVKFVVGAIDNVLYEKNEY